MRKGLSFLLTLAMVLGLFAWGPFASIDVASAAESIPEEAMTPGDILAYHGDVSRTAIGLKRAKNSSYYGGVYAYDFKLKNKKSNSIMTSYWGMYGSAAKLGASVSGGTALDITKANNIGSNVTVSMNFTGMKNANIIRVGYVIKNAGSSAQTVTVGGTVDTDIAGDDYAKIENFKNGNSVGLISTARGGEFLSFSTDGDYWYGQWTSSEVNNSTFTSFIQKAAGVRGKDPNLGRADGTYDSCMNWLWKSVSVPAGSTVTKYCYWGVGDVTAGDDPAEIKTAAAPAAVTWDANAGNATDVRGIPSGGRTATDDNNNITLPTLTRDGYIFEGWYTQAAGGTLIGAGGTQYHTESNVTLYAHWRAIVSTVNVALKMGSTPYGGQSVQLYSGNELKHSLTETNTAGTYTTGGVVNGTYAIGVNGARTGDTVTVAATSVASTQTKNVTVTLKKVEITTELDGALSYTPGEVTLRQDGRVAYTLKSTIEGVWTVGVIIASGGTFDVYVGGVDSGVDVTAGSLEKTIAYHTAKVTITDDAPWTTATVILRDSAGKAVVTLPYTSTDGNKTTYERMIREQASELTVDLGGLDTGKTIGGQNYTADITCYTAKLDITCSDAGTLPLSATMSGSGRNYAFKKGTPGGDKVSYTVEHILDNGDTGYQVSLTGVSLEGVNSEYTIKASDKTKDLSVHVVNFKKYTTTNNTTYTAEDSGSKAFVLSGGKVKAPESYLSGYTHDGWSTEEWTDSSGKPKTDAYTAFDFTDAINGDKTLYPHYLPPTVRINEFVRTDAQGVPVSDGSDSAYRLGNIVISGFDQSDESIRYVIFGGMNIEKIEAKDLPTGATYDEASKVLEFSPLVSMAEAQDCIRNHIIITPTRTGSTNDDGTIKVTVLDKNGNLDSGSSSAPTQYGAGVSALPVTAGSTLSAGCFYYLRASTVITSTTAGQSALNVATGNPVYLYIPSGVTLTVKGGDASGTTGAGAGIKVPSDATLYLLGEGTLVATGGAAENGQNGGQNKNDALFYGYDSNDCKDGFYRAGTGGAGGAGGGGAGAGIGGTGGNGGAGGTCAATTSRSDGNRVNGLAGGDGGNGTNGSASGSVYICGSMSVTATGGAAGSNGSAATKGTSVRNFYISNSDTYNSGMADFACQTTGTTYWANFYCAGPGGIGGYGIGGGAASNIGGGGAGGAGGGAGGQGAFAKAAVDNASTARSTSVSADTMSSGGNGKNGGVSGHNSGTTYSGPYKNGNDSDLKTGGQGGAGGTNGTKGSDGSCTVASTAKLNGSDGTGGNPGSFTITYTKANSSDTCETPSKTSYVFGSGESIILPTYTPASSDKIFRGWRLTTYGVELGGVSDNPLASNEGKIYPAGAVLPISSTMAGNLTFKAVVAVKDGLYAEDTANYTATKLKTYTVTTTVNGQPCDVGELLFGAEKVRGLNGVYVYSTTSTNVTVKAGVETIAEMTASDENLNASATAEFENIKVTVTGYKPSDVTLGDGGPVLMRTSTNDTTQTYVYESGYRPVEDEKGSYAIKIDGTAVGKNAKYGSNKNVAYHTITINLQPTKARNVTLKDAAGNILITRKVGDGESNTFTYTKLADAETTYDVYADGTLTGARGIAFDSTRTVDASYYVIGVTVTLDGVKSDAVGVPSFGADVMMWKETGVYTFASSSATSKNILMSGETVKASAAANANVTLDYFTITYQKAEGAEDHETGELPAPTYCLSGGSGILAVNTLKNGAKNFGGWVVDGNLYRAGSEVSVTAASTATATWANQSLNDLTPDGRCTTVIFDKSNFGYDGTVKTPVIDVYVGNDKLTENTDYTITYLKNSNTDESAGAVNVRAGTVTVVVTGMGDYTGVLTKTYEILPRLVMIKDVIATSRAYDGGTDVSISGGTLDGVADPDKNNSSKLKVVDLAGVIDTPDVEFDPEGNVIAKRVRLKKGDNGEYLASLDGSRKSDYVLVGIDGENVTVEITKKNYTLTDIEVYDKAYDKNTDATIVQGSAKFAESDLPDELKDNPIITGKAEFADADVGENKTVTISNIRFVGDSLKNFGLTTDSITTRASIVKAAQLAPAPGEGYQIAGGKITVNADPGSRGTNYEVLWVNPKGTTEAEKSGRISAGATEDIDPYRHYSIRWNGNTNYQPSFYTEVVTDVPEGKRIATLPVAKEGLVCNDNMQTGVEGGTGYDLSGEYEAKDPSTGDGYIATAKLQFGYIWPDGTSKDKTIRWTIAKRPQTAPDVYYQDDPDDPNSDNGVIVYPAERQFPNDPESGYKKVEYSADGGKTWITLPADGDIRPGYLTDGLEEGKTYLFRYAEDDKHKPSASIPVTVGEKPVIPKTKLPSDIALNGTTVSTKLNGDVKTTTGVSFTFMYRKAGETTWISINPGAGTLETNGRTSYAYTLNNLDPDTLYEFKAVAGKAGKTREGETLTFRTLATSPVPTDGSISISIHNESGEDTDVLVTVEEGNTPIDSQSSKIDNNKSGTAVFTGLHYGFYNVVVRAKEYTSTRMLSVGADNKTVSTTFTIPSGKLSTIVEIGEDAPDTAVDGLNDILTEKDMNEAAKGAKDVEVKLAVEKKDETGANNNKAEGIEEIKGMAPKADFPAILDISLFKTVTELDKSGEAVSVDSQNIGKTNKKVIEIAIPIRMYQTLQNALKLLMYRFHAGVSEKLTKLSERPKQGDYVDGTYFVDREFVFLYASGFSTYAIGYEGTSGGGSSSGGAAEPAAPTGEEPTPTASPSTPVAPDPAATPEPTTTLDPKKDTEEAKNDVDLNNDDAVTKNGRTVYNNKLSLNAGLKVSQPGKKIVVQWSAVPGANRYEVYATYCGMKFGKKSTKVVKSGDVTTVTIKKLLGKKLNLKKNYKLYVVAYKVENGVRYKLAKSITAHIVGRKNQKYSNPKKLTCKTKKLTLKKNKTITLKPKVKLVNAKRKSLSNHHAPKFRYASSDKKIAKVDKNGKIKGLKKGTCVIYIYAKNGFAKKVRVKVK